MRTLIPTVALLSLIPFSLYAAARSNSGGLADKLGIALADGLFVLLGLQLGDPLLHGLYLGLEIIIFSSRGRGASHQRDRQRK